MELWGARVERGSVEMFPILEDVLARAGLKVEFLQQAVCAHLEGMREQFGEYFGEETMANQWVRNPFSFPVTLKDGLSAGEEEALAELSCDMDLKQRMSDVSLAHFWLSVGTEFPQLSMKI